MTRASGKVGQTALSIGIVVASDRCAAGRAPDRSGALLHSLCCQAGFRPEHPVIVPDEIDAIREALLYATDTLKAEVVFTVGGTGMGPRDVTPEATGPILDRLLPGLPEAVRVSCMSAVPAAMLSRAVAGTRKGSLVINLPGSPGGVRDGFRVLAPVLTHAMQMMDGQGHDERDGRGGDTC